MKRYIIIDTWNGEGYTDSTAGIYLFENDAKAKEYCLNKAKDQADAMGTIIEQFRGGEGYRYKGSDDDDHGAFAFLEVTKPIKGVILSPCVNHYTVIDTQKEWDNQIRIALRDGEYDEDQEALLKSGNAHTVFVHANKMDNDMFFFELDVNAKVFDEGDLEFDDGGDGVEYEVWKDDDGQLYKIEIQIVRDFANATKVKSYHEAKFG